MLHRPTTACPRPQRPLVTFASCHAQDRRVPRARDWPPVLDTAGAAELLGVNIDKMRAMAREGEVPAHLLPGNRVYRFLTDELLEWLRNQPGDRQQAADRIDG